MCITRYIIQEAVYKRKCVNWYKKFYLNNYDTENQLRSDRLKVVDDDQLKEYVNANLEAKSSKMSAKFQCN